MSGWIRLYRSILNDDLYTELEAKQRDVLINVLLMASYEEKEWVQGRGKSKKTRRIKPGQFVSSIRKIASNCAPDVNENTVKYTLEKLRDRGFLTWESTNKDRTITITNWEIYQPKPEEENEVEEPEEKPESEKKDKKKKDGTKPPRKKTPNKYDTEFDQLWQEYPNKKGKVEALRGYRKHRKAGISTEDFKGALERYKREIKRENRDKKYIMQGKRFFNTGFEDYLEDETENTVQAEPQRLEMPGMDFLSAKLEEAMDNL